MQPSTSTKNKKTFFQNDRALVCSMFIFYGLCILGLAGAGVWGWNWKRDQLAANATSTANAAGTKQANATATAIVSTTKQAQYEIYDSFDDNGRYWLTESIDDEYLNGSISVSTGLYVWNIREIKQPFVYWANVKNASWGVQDFDMYVDSKVVDGTMGNVCTGFVFRSASNDWEDGAYTFSVCNNATFDVHYYKAGDWDALSEQVYAKIIQAKDWNRLEVSARGDEFIFRINHEVVYRVTDDRIKQGGLALLVEVEGEDPATIWFDNFGLQRR